MGGFTLGITNPPPGAYCWTALFYYEPRIYSPVLGLDELWDYAEDPEGRTDLMVRVFDDELREIFTDSNLGPIEDGKSYTYDCSTGELKEIKAALPTIAKVAGIGVLTVLGIALVAKRKK